MEATKIAGFSVSATVAVKREKGRSVLWRRPGQTSTPLHRPPFLTRHPGTKSNSSETMLPASRESARTQGLPFCSYSALDHAPPMISDADRLSGQASHGRVVPCLVFGA